ncbi:hypothetical protein [Legionella longbeachae]|uniref:Uncharacterized protein n=1 Tax=Legionella longbeachae serogroup 1 (strain NSW150) TaxID=661367 RepID=D3HM67_LEGLN|nr:hypothetical protein [Legionella longbeachae]VEE03979.1 Uncharacterised protein [Legionella oakridgensis]HBD7397238.1 hypothetical protein [Legionella pneumophila]ARB93164.1 hypothetical protein A6J40_13715 [Legionella longbeachae]ARM33772.1 hypothetical protein B0B39_09625 [Legionella longbeachae]EEZ97066.1 hypothetical protein LLB_2268 [Legionella longbeachae D-4968]
MASTKSDKNSLSNNTMIVFNFPNRSSYRRITVINNYPWYQSTGKNSGYEGTWFFFGGILETKTDHHARGWLIKPKSLAEERYNQTRFFGSNIYHYVHKHSIHKLVSFSRFGDIEKACISASIGGGFWRTSKGKHLKGYLKKTYSRYFLPPEIIKDIRQLAMSTDLTIYSDPEQVNFWLREQGVTTLGVLHNESLLIRP